MSSNCILQYNTVRKTTNAIHLRDLVWLQGFPLTTVHYHPYAIHTCIYYLMAEKVITYTTSVRPYFHEPQVSENAAQECIK